MTRVVLVGGGLANGLLASCLAARRPDVEILVLEAGATLGGNHTWSFHESDVTPPELDRLRVAGAKPFAAGHDVELPGFARRLSGTYWALRSADFHRALARLPVRFGVRATEVGPTHVVLDDAERIDADAVVDARAQAPAWPCGWQKFLGQDLELESPHGLERPLLMDATVEQTDGFRFVYALPWSRTRVLVEDTVYSDAPALDLVAIRARIGQWVAARGWRISAVEREEHAALPIPLAGAAPTLERPVLGVSAGFFHATTGYSVPFAVRNAVRLAALERLDAASLTACIAAEARRHWRTQGFFRLLNRMLFLAAAPGERVRVFTSFYGHDEGLIARFYAGKPSPVDVLRVVARGSGTVPLGRAARAALAGRASRHSTAAVSA